jgi:hypothetical protein
LLARISRIATSNINNLGKRVRPFGRALKKTGQT